MRIQQFADRLKQTCEPSPLLQALQALRTQSLDELRAVQWGEWTPWMENPLAPQKGELG